MVNLHIDLTAPNGLTFKQPVGLFINNEWVPSLSKGDIVTINPA